MNEFEDTTAREPEKIGVRIGHERVELLLAVGDYTLGRTVEVAPVCPWLYQKQPSTIDRSSRLVQRQLQKYSAQAPSHHC